MKKKNNNKIQDLNAVCILKKPTATKIFGHSAKIHSIGEHSRMMLLSTYC